MPPVLKSYIEGPGHKGGDLFLKWAAHSTVRKAVKSRHPMFKVQRKLCSTCIYLKDSPLDLKQLEAAVADGFGGFRGHRICHHSDDVCCRGFWNRHKDQFAMGQVAQRLGWVQFVDVDTLEGEMR